MRCITCEEVGLQDGELLILEDLHDLFLGNLAPQRRMKLLASQESGQFTMEEMLDKVPTGEASQLRCPQSGGQELEECTATLFLDVLSAFEISTSDASEASLIPTAGLYAPQEMDFWHGVRWKLQQLLDKRALWDKKLQESDMEMLKEGLHKLQKLLLVKVVLHIGLSVQARFCDQTAQGEPKANLMGPSRSVDGGLAALHVSCPCSGPRFKHHDTRHRVSLILASLPIRRKASRKAASI